MIGEDVEESLYSSGIISTVAMETLDELAPPREPILFEEDDDRRLLTLKTLRKRLENDSLVPMDMSDRMENDWLALEEVDVMDDRRPESAVDIDLLLELALGIRIGRAEEGCCINMDFGLRDESVEMVWLLGRRFLCCR